MQKELSNILESKLDNNLNFSIALDNNSITHGNSLGEIVSSGTLNIDNADCQFTDMSCWGYWQDYYYPRVIHESYPVYLQDRSKDKGKQAFEIIKMLKDKKIVKLKTVSDFIDAMDALIKIL